MGVAESGVRRAKRPLNGAAARRLLLGAKLGRMTARVVARAVVASTTVPTEPEASVEAELERVTGACEQTMALRALPLGAAIVGAGVRAHEVSFSAGRSRGRE